MANRLNTFLLVLVLVALVAVIAMLATGVRGGPLDPPGPPGSTASVRLPGTPISSGPTTITQPGHYYLTNDINVSGAVNAIVISANNVSLDLGGFTIDGTDTVGSTGIVATSTLSVRIENGTVQDFHVGVNTNPVEGARIDGIDAVSNIRGFEVGSRTVVSDCQATANTENGIAILGQSSVVRDCLVLANTLDGIAVLGSGNIVERTKVASSTQGSDIRAGASAPGTHLRDNDVGDIRLESGSNVVVDNVCDAASPDIVDASVFIDFIAVAASPHENFECSVVQE